MPQLNINVAAKAAATLGQKIYPAVIAASLVQATDPDQTIAIVFKEGALTLVKENPDAIISLEVEEDPNVVYGSENVLRALIKAFPQALAAQNPEQEKWVQFALDRLTGTNFNETKAAIDEIDHHLAVRTFLGSYQLSIADIAVFGTLRGSNAAFLNIKKGFHPNLSRWFKFVEADSRVNKAVEAIREELSSSRKAKAQTSNFEIGLLDTEKGVCTRFPPEPSGYLHIGHAKAAMLNQYMAEKYNGKLIIRFDDTNPSKEKQEFEDSIIEDLELLGIKASGAISYSSNYFPQLYDQAIKMIELGKAYCDDTDQATMRDQRMNGVPSVKRDTSVEENLRIFKEEMTNATEVGQKFCLRAKISVDSPNKALRDPVIYRCNPQPHHRTGSTWKIYPTYDFTCPIVDSLEGVTHALRTTEYHDRNDQYQWMLKTLGLRKVHIWDFARLNFVRTLLSKRKLQWFVEQGLVTGWDDPRFPTVRGIRRRGMTIEGLKQFILAQGPSKNVVLQDWSAIWATNKKIIDPIAPRFTAVIAKDVVTVDVEDATSSSENKPKHIKNPDLGLKAVYYGPRIVIDQADAQSFTEGEEITLMNWGNAFVGAITKDATSGLVTGMSMKLNLAGDVKSTKKKITWLESTTQKLVDVELVDYDFLITKDKMEEGDQVENYLNKETEFREAAVADENVAGLAVGDVMQFERKGYFRLDQKNEGGKPAVFIAIPTGKK